MAIKQKAIERNNYYSNIGFTNLANEFSEFVKFFDEIEAYVRVKEKEGKEDMNNGEK